ncbi:cation:proton antiporter [Fervidobacterium thailandense]|uniref:Cation:proton antiporter n=2 Tax=Fervidobacterium thailandense TaxID=1008305 RepID=A0A1E3G554_9BACT|nr:cation:proton antiporter subunit C [Fervidobacterium thailandense]ODN30778.1 cation:proton antiporter [Fervidobacterium thailandense]
MFREALSVPYYYLPLFLVAIGIYGIVSQKNLFKQLVSLGLIDTGVNIFIISLGYIQGMEAPIYSAVTPVAKFVDPLPQALVLTAIVIGVGILGLGAALLIKVHERYGTLELDELRIAKERQSQQEITDDEGDVGA